MGGAICGVPGQPVNRLFQCDVFFQGAGGFAQMQFVTCKHAINHLVDKLLLWAF